MKTKMMNLGMVLWLVLGSLLAVSPAAAEEVSVDIWHDPGEPSIHDWVSFGIFESTEGAICAWDFGDGTTSADCYIAAKQFAADGDYTVIVDVTFSDGITGHATEDVTVRTHDVGITKFNVPQSARTGQTRQITVYVSNKRYPETVQVDLYANGNMFGSLRQDVPVRSNRTTAFNFSYTFTTEDARLGKVVFKAVAFLPFQDFDDWWADNEAIARLTKVTR